MGKLPQVEKLKIIKGVDKLYKYKKKLQKKKSKTKKKKKKKKKQNKNKNKNKKNSSKKILVPLRNKTDSNEDNDIIYKRISIKKTLKKNIKSDDLHNNNEIRSNEESSDLKENNQKKDEEIYVNKEDEFSGTMSAFNNINESAKSKINSKQNFTEINYSDSKEFQEHSEKETIQKINKNKNSPKIIDKDDDKSIKKIQKLKKQKKNEQFKNSKIINIGHQDANYSPLNFSSKNKTKDITKTSEQEKKSINLDKIPVLRNQINENEIKKTDIKLSLIHI